jgi:hypothetical protein
MNWGGKNWRPGAPTNRRQPINQSVAELMKPLGEKSFQGNVWGSVIMNVPLPDTTPTPSPTPTPTPSISAKFVAFGVSDAFQSESPTYYSLNGSDWSASTTTGRNMSDYDFDIQYNDIQNKWITIGNDLSIDESTDGITFDFNSISPINITKIVQGTSSPIDYNIAISTTFLYPNLLVDFDNVINTSYGDLFGSSPTPLSGIFCSFPTQDIWLAGYAASTYEAYGYNLGTDPNSETWSGSSSLNDYIGQPSEFASNYDANTQSETLVVAVGTQSATQSMAAVSNDGLTWTGETSSLYNSFNNLNCVIWDGSKFITGGQSNTVVPSAILATSTDGITWVVNTGTTAGSTTIENITDIAFDGTTYVALGYSPLLTTTVILTSTDGFDWNIETLSLPTDVRLLKVDSNPHPYRR